MARRATTSSAPLAAVLLLTLFAGLVPVAATARPAGDRDRPDPDGAGMAAIRFAHPPRPLRHGTPQEAGLAPEPLGGIGTALHAGLATTPHPRFPGAVVVVARGGVIAAQRAVGHAARYADDTPTELPASARRPAHPSTIFDLASVSKLFTAIVVMQLVEQGRLELDAPVARWIPAFAAAGKQQVTVRHLLAHTSGLPAWLPLHRDHPTRDARLAAVHATAPQAPPGATTLYSDLNLITLGELAEAAGGRPLDELVADGITRPLGMRDTGYNPPWYLRSRIAATEYQRATGRGLVWGEVHDENAWALGGVAGHAGVFSTAADLAVLAQTLLNGGSYGQARILRPDTVRQMLTAQPGTAGRRGLGLELNQPSYMGALAGPVTAGHTGFTGTSLVIDPDRGLLVILLTSRVHPSREWGSVNPTRRVVADAAAAAADAFDRAAPGT